MPTDGVGPKTQNLVKLQKAGFPVPSFVFFSVSDLTQKTIEQLAAETIERLPTNFYAVRSSALTEDMANQSMAGQFTTKLNVNQERLVEAMSEVLADAKQKLGSLDQFSLLIQEYIPADFSGVLFTRNPASGRECVVEWSQGVGEALVSGKVSAKRFSVYRNQQDVFVPFPQWPELMKQAMEIEKLFGFPQDIEWAVRGNQLFILQSRPITTLSKEDVETAEFLDQALPKGKFYLEKTGVTEVAPTPSDETMELLEELYADDGPIAAVYRRLGIIYHNTHFLTRIGGQLYVDKEKELRSLLPAYSYLSSSTYKPRAVRLKGFWTSLQNTLKLNKPIGDPLDFYQQLKQRFETADEDFSADYELIFSINLAVDQAVRTSRPCSSFPVLQPPTELIGNSLDLNDTSKFVPAPMQEEAVDSAQQWSRLREYGRWLMVKHLSMRREQRSSTANLFPHPLPHVLTDRPMEVDHTKPLGVSAGQATGVLVDETTYQPNKKDQILLVRDLLPSLTKYLPDIVGVLSENGNLLSHFAIIARESHLPVIVGISNRDYPLGSKVMMDGSTGEIHLVDSSHH